MNYYIYNDELYHHGILGMKWGVRRYQNPDGSLTEAGRKRYLKTLYKEVRKDRKSERFKELSTDYVRKAMSNEQKDTLLKLRKDARNKEKERTLPFEYGGAKEFDDLLKESHNKTYEWFKKNNPKFLKDALKQVNGDEGRLNEFHDFEKMYEGYMDSLWNKYEQKWRDNNSNAYKAEIEADKAWDKYIVEAKSAVRNILGEYGNKPISSDLPIVHDLTEEVWWNAHMSDVLDEYEKNRK